MEARHFKELAEKASNEDLFDIIYNNPFSDNELAIFKDEVKARGLEAELIESVKMKDLNKNKIKETLKELPKEDLLTIVVYNRYKFTEEELTLFKNEVNARGLDKELAEAVRSETAGALEFKETVLDASEDPFELLQNFNSYNEKKYPEIVSRIEKDRIKKAKNKSIINAVVGVLLLVTGVVLTVAVEGDIIFYGAILVGFILIVRSIITYVKLRVQKLPNNAY